MNPRHLLPVFSLLIFPALPISAEPGAPPLPKLETFAVEDLAGQRHQKADWRDRKAVVVLFLDRECPVSNAFAPELTRIHRAYAPKDVAFFGSYPDPYSKKEDAAAHGREFGLEFPLIHDPAQTLAKQAGIEIIPSAVVLSPNGQVLYRGRINNRWEPDGTRRRQPTVHDLRNALDAVLRGDQPDPKETPSFGCYLLTPPKPSP